MFRRVHHKLKDLPVSGLVCLVIVVSIAIPTAIIFAFLFHRTQEIVLHAECSSLYSALSAFSLPEDTPPAQISAQAGSLVEQLAQGQPCTWYLLDGSSNMADSGTTTGIPYSLTSIPQEDRMKNGYTLYQDPYRGKMLFLSTLVTADCRLAVIFPISGFQIFRQYFSALLPLAVLLELAGTLCLVLLLRKYLILPMRQLLSALRYPGDEQKILPYRQWNSEVGRICNAYLERSREYRDSLAQIGKLSAEQRASEIEVLQNQINAHFIYNTLNNIQWLASANRMEDVVHTAQSLDILLRACARNDSDYVSIEDEMTYVGAYLSAQKIRFHDLFDYTFELDPLLMQMKIPKFIVQPIVENSIYHGFLESDRTGGQIRVSVFRRGYRVIIEVYDNGVGIAASDIFPILNNTRKSSDRYMGVAIGNINKRIRLLCGRDYGIGIESRKGSFTKVQLILPIVAG